MKKFIVLNLVGLVVVAALSALLLRNARSAASTLNAVDGFSTVQNEAGEIRAQMIAMSDAMRGFLLNPSRQEEYDNKKQADAALSKAVERLLANTTNAEYAELARQIGQLDEQKLDPIEDRVLDLAPRDAKAATSVYFNEYLPVRVQQMNLVDKLGRLAGEGFTGQVAAATAEAHRPTTLVLWAGGAVVLLMCGAFAWSVRTTRSVERQLAAETAAMSETAGSVLRASREVSRAAQSLSQGATEQAASLEADLRVDGGDGVDDAAERRELAAGRER